MLCAIAARFVPTDLSAGHYSARIGISLLELTHVIIDSLETITLANRPPYHHPFFPFGIVSFTAV